MTFRSLSCITPRTSDIDHIIYKKDFENFISKFKTFAVYLEVLGVFSIISGSELQNIGKIFVKYDIEAYYPLKFGCNLRLKMFPKLLNSPA